jgi:hypothetical protein
VSGDVLDVRSPLGERTSHDDVTGLVNPLWRLGLEQPCGVGVGVGGVAS